MSEQHIVLTKFGQVALIATDADHIYATTNPEGGRNMLPWTIRGKVYQFVTAHLHRWSDGQFHLAEEKYKDNTYLQRRNGLFFTEGTEFAKTEAVRELEFAAVSFSNRHPEVFRAADIDSKNDRIDGLKKKREDLAAELRSVTDEIGALVEEVSVLKFGLPARYSHEG